MTSFTQRGLAQLHRYAKTWHAWIHAGRIPPKEVVERIEYRDRHLAEVDAYLAQKLIELGDTRAYKDLERSYGQGPNSIRGRDYDFLTPVTPDDADRWLHLINTTILSICEYHLDKVAFRNSEKDLDQFMTSVTLSLMSLATRISADLINATPAEGGAGVPPALEEGAGGTPAPPKRLGQRFRWTEAFQQLLDDARNGVPPLRAPKAKRFGRNDP